MAGINSIEEVSEHDDDIEATPKPNAGDFLEAPLDTYGNYETQSPALEVK